MRAVEFEGWAALERGALGIPRPRTTEDRSAEVEIAIVPALAFTRQGDRLGYGGGYYDRWLARYPLAVRIGVCRENEIRTGLPTAPHDEPVDALVTEAGARSCGTRRRR
jgi:5-formyltetrahydrofolate cyclo-ligase